MGKGRRFYPGEIEAIMEKYNGYSNYPTWNAALWIDNDQGFYSERLGIVQKADNKAEAANTLKEWFEELFPIPTTGPIADMAGWALAHIDWHELAEHWWDERDEEEVEA